MPLLLILFVNSNIVFEESQEPTSFFPPVNKSRGNPMAMDLARNSSTKQIRTSTVLQGLLIYSLYPSNKNSNITIH